MRPATQAGPAVPVTGMGKNRPRKPAEPDEAGDDLGPVPTRLPNGTREWRRGGQLHRDDGPAVEYPDGTT